MLNPHPRLQIPAGIGLALFDAAQAAARAAARKGRGLSRRQGRRKWGRALWFVRARVAWNSAATGDGLRKRGAWMGRRHGLNVARASQCRRTLAMAQLAARVAGGFLRPVLRAASVIVASGEPRAHACAAG